MFDINSLLPQMALLKQKVTRPDATLPAQSFSSVLTKKIEDVAGPETDPTLDSVSSLPDDIKKMIQDLADGTPMDEAGLKVGSKKLSIMAMGLTDMINNSVPGPDVAQAEIDLQVVLFGSFQTGLRLTRW
jgi:hypothetical protein